MSGQRGTGKTTFIRQHILARATRFLVFDHMAEFSELEGAEVVWTLEDAIRFLRKNRVGLARCVVVPGDRDRARFDLFCRAPFAIPDLTLVCDELDAYAGAVRPPPPPDFTRMIHFGRHFGCSFVGASRRPADVSRAFTSQATRIVCFRQTEPNDIRYLRSILGDQVEELKTLEPLSYMSWHDGQLERGQVTP